VNSFDYVIIGAGSAGCVLASRLSEDPDVRVLVIEAGGPDSAQEIHVPVTFARLFKTDLDWDYDTEAEPGLDGRRVYLPRGKVFGGSSSINAMVYIRGNRADYDGWAAAGATGWSYADVLPYFRRSEDNQRGASEYHGAGGPLTVSDGRSNHPLAEAFRRRGRAGRLQAQRRLQRRDPGRGRDLPAHAAQRPALQCRGRLPAPGADTAQPRGHAGRGGAPGGGRARPRGSRSRSPVAPPWRRCTPTARSS
jgi:choline dehydrogenase-like flavoprotein